MTRAIFLATAVANTGIAAANALQCWRDQLMVLSAMFAFLAATGLVSVLVLIAGAA